MAWQPIETAPRDGTAVLLYCASGYQIVAKYERQYLPDYNWEGWVSCYEGWDTGEATHWMPLPEPPGK